MPAAKLCLIDLTGEATFIHQGNEGGHILLGRRIPTPIRKVPTVCYTIFELVTPAFSEKTCSSQRYIPLECRVKFDLLIS